MTEEERREADVVLAVYDQGREEEQERVLMILKKLREDYNKQVEEAWVFTLKAAKAMSDDFKLAVLGEVYDKKGIIEQIKKRTDWGRTFVNMEVSYAHSKKKEYKKINIVVLEAKVGVLDQAINAIKEFPT